MNPIEASQLAAELLAHMDALSTLDLHPYTSAEDIEMHRREALACSTLLSGYLVASANFEGVNA